jgi:Protein of unknown function (DUF1501)
MQAGCGLFAGGGVNGGSVLGKADEIGGKVIGLGWQFCRPVYIEDVAATIYSAIGIDWTNKLKTRLPGRAFHYIEPASATEYVYFEPVREMFV